METNTSEIAVDKLEQAKFNCIDKFSKHLNSEIILAKNGVGFYDRQFYLNYLDTKYAHQNAMNEFYNILHDLSK